MSTKYKILVTGSSGFLGSHLADNLTKEGHKVILFDNLPSNYKNKKQIEFVGSILDIEALKKAMKGCDYVYHFAAQSDIDLSTKKIQNTIDINITGTLNVLQLAKINKVKKIIFASTVYVDSNLGSFYKITKHTCEHLLLEFCRLYKLNYTTIRFGSLYGRRSGNNNSLHNMISNVILNKKLIRYGNGEEIREYINVEDAAQTSVKLLNKKYNNNIFILSGQNPIKIKDLIVLIEEIFQKKIKVDYKKFGNTNHYRISPVNYNLNKVKKISLDTYYDLNQGLLDLIYHIENEN